MGKWLDNGSRVNREVYARFCERLRAKFLGSTHQQSYTDLVRYVILLHRIRDGYLTMVDLFRTVISAGKLEDMLAEVGSRFSTVSYIGIDKDAYREHESLLSPLGFEWNKDPSLRST